MSTQKGSFKFCKILHWNVWSILEKRKFLLYFQILNDNQIDIALVNETWFQSEKGLFSKRAKDSGYNVFHAFRENKRGGGVAIFYKNTLSIKDLNASTSLYSSFEFSSVIVSLKSASKILLVSIYRKQEIHYSIFRDEWMEFMDQLLKRGESIMVVGDLNLWVDIVTDKEANDFLSLMNAYGLDQKVTEPTHRSGHTLDHIYVNSYQIDISHEIVEDFCGVSSDHFPILMKIPLLANQDNTKFYVKRALKSVNLDTFRVDVSEMCQSIDNQSDFSAMIHQYIDKGKKLMEKHAPLKRCKYKPRAVPWMDAEYKKNRALRRKLEKKWKANSTEMNRLNYMKQKSLCCTMSLEKQKSYYSSIVKKCSSQKELFRVANDLLDKSKERVLPSYTEPVGLANRFNDFFIEKVNKIRNSIPTPKDSVNQYSRPFNSEKLCIFRPASCDEVHSVIKEFGMKTSEEDPIPSALLSSSLDIVLPVFTDIINKSLKEGCMDGIKESVVTPLLKKSGLDSEIFKNFRPVNTLLFLSKLIERIVLIRLNEHMSLHNLHDNSQFGYKKFHSTEIMVLGLVDEVLRGFDENLATIIIILDLSAAFDTIDINKLIRILRYEIGIDGIALKWFHSFLTNRLQRVKIDHCYSDCREVPCGVPQGSVLGPVLFNINVRSQPMVFKECAFTTSSFADDSNGRKQFSLSFQFNVLTKDTISCIDKIVNWSHAHYMKINSDKTEIMLACPSSLNSATIIQGIFIDGQCIRFTSKAKNVGVLIDKNLTFNLHINSLVSHCYALLRDIGKIKQYLKKNDLEKLVHAVVSHRLDYCNSLYINMNKSNIYKLQKCQNAAARMILGKKRSENADFLLKELHWLPVETRVVYKIILIVFKVLSGQCTSFELTYKTNNLRSGNDLLLETPNFKTKYGKRIFAYSGTRYWNALPNNLRIIKDIEKFKKDLKTLLFTNFEEIKQKAFIYKPI